MTCYVSSGILNSTQLNSTVLSNLCSQLCCLKLLSYCMQCCGNKVLLWMNSRQQTSRPRPKSSDNSCLKTVLRKTMSLHSGKSDMSSRAMSWIKAALATLTILSCRHVDICCRSNETAVSSFCKWRWLRSSTSIATVNNSRRDLCTVSSLITFIATKQYIPYYRYSDFRIFISIFIFQYVVVLQHLMQLIIYWN